MNSFERALEIAKDNKLNEIVEELKKKKNPKLIEQILNINFKQIEELKKQIGKEKKYNNDTINRIEYKDGNNLSKEEKQIYEKIGEDIIKKGQYAVVTMAGGQRYKIRI